MLSDARAATAFVDRALGAKPPAADGSSVPNGVRLDGPSMQTYAPSKRLSLHAHYEWRMRRAVEQRDAPRLLMLAAMATRDCMEHEGTYHVERYEFHEEAVNALLRDWSGHGSGEVAVWLGVPEKWVRRQRTLNGRDPDYGEEREQPELLRKVVEMTNHGASSRTIASIVGKSHITIQRMLNGS